MTMSLRTLNIGFALLLLAGILFSCDGGGSQGDRERRMDEVMTPLTKPLPERERGRR